MRSDMAAMPTIALDVTKGLHVVVRPYDDPRAAGVPDVGALLRASNLPALLSAIAPLDHLERACAASEAMDSAAVVELVRSRRLADRLPALARSEGRIVQGRLSRSTRHPRPLPSVLDVASSSDRLIIEPLAEWSLTVNLLAASLALCSPEASLVGLEAVVTEEGTILPICHDPSYRVQVPGFTRPIEESRELPLLHRLRSCAAATLERDAATHDATMRLSADRSVAASQAIAAAEMTLSSWATFDEGRPVCRPDGAASQLWHSATAERDVRVFVCARCGRVAVSAGRGVASRYCSNACRAEAARAEGRW